MVFLHGFLMSSLPPDIRIANPIERIGTFAQHARSDPPLQHRIGHQVPAFERSSVLVVITAMGETRTRCMVVDGKAEQEEVEQQHQHARTPQAVQ